MEQAARSSILLVIQYVPQCERVALRQSSTRLAKHLSMETARLRRLHQSNQIFKEVVHRFCPLSRTSPPNCDGWEAWLENIGAPRENNNTYWAHTVPATQAPWWLKHLSEELISRGAGFALERCFDTGCLGPYGWPDPAEPIPETWVLDGACTSWGSARWDVQRRYNYTAFEDWRMRGPIIDIYFTMTSPRSGRRRNPSSDDFRHEYIF